MSGAYADPNQVVGLRNSRTYRVRKPNRWLPLLIAIAVVQGVYGLIKIFAVRQPGTTRWIPWLGVIAVVSVTIVVLLWRSYRAVAITHCDGIAVRNVLRNYSFTWDEVAGFSVGTSTTSTCIAILHLHTGRTIPVWGVRGARGWLLDNSAETTELVERLNDDRRARMQIDAALRGQDAVSEANVGVASQSRTT